MAEIQGNIVKRNKRGAISRRFYKKDDDEAIATWKLDLDRILRVLNVRSVTFILSLPTFHFQMEPEVTTRADTRRDVANTRTIVPDIHHDPPNPNSVVFGAHHDVPKTQATVSDIHPNMLKNREDKGSQNVPVSGSY